MKKKINKSELKLLVGYVSPEADHPSRDSIMEAVEAVESERRTVTLTEIRQYFGKEPEFSNQDLAFVVDAMVRDGDLRSFSASVPSPHSRADTQTIAYENATYGISRTHSTESLRECISGHLTCGWNLSRPGVGRGSGPPASRSRVGVGGADNGMARGTRRADG